MTKDVKKYRDFINESAVSELEIREFAKEEMFNIIDDLFEKMAKKFPIDSSKLSQEENMLKDKLISEFSKLIAQVTINNISVLNDKKNEDIDEKDLDIEE